MLRFALMALSALHFLQHHQVLAFQHAPCSPSQSTASSNARTCIRNIGNVDTSMLWGQQRRTQDRTHILSFRLHSATQNDQQAQQQKQKQERQNGQKNRRQRNPDDKTSKNRRVQLSWQRKMNKQRKTVQWKLRGVVDSIDRLDTSITGSIELMRPLYDLISESSNPHKVSQIARTIMDLDIARTESVEVQERVVKALTLCGLRRESVLLIEQMLKQNNLPSKEAFSAVLQLLRKSGNHGDLESMLQKLAAVAKQAQKQLHPVAMNVYVASLCQDCDSPDDPRLGAAANLLNKNVAYETYHIKPDGATFNTVLGAAVRTKNATLVNQVVETMHANAVQFDICTYNTIMKTKDSARKLELLQEIEDSPQVAPDRYTIGIVIVPLVQTGRIGELHILLENFIVQTSPSLVCDAFSAFLFNLVQCHELAAAQELFERYIGTNGDKTDQNQHPHGIDGSISVSVRPHAKQFNILMKAYIDELEYHNSKVSELREGDPDRDMSMLVIDQYRKQAWGLYHRMLAFDIKPDEYTISTLMTLCDSSHQLTDLVLHFKDDLQPSSVRAAMAMYGRVGDPESSCVLFDSFSSRSSNSRAYNSLLVGLASGAKQGNPVLNIANSPLLAALEKHENKEGGSHSNTRRSTTMADIVDGQECSVAAMSVLDTMSSPDSTMPGPNSQTYCTVASAVQYGRTDAYVALELFRSAMSKGIAADGRFINAIFRCFGDDIKTALESWKLEIRFACLDCERRTANAPKSVRRSKSQNLIAAYQGLLYVCGRAEQPKIALRLVYAMQKEGIEPNVIDLSCYRSGKRQTRELAKQEGNKRPVLKALAQLGLVAQYESLLEVECSKYNQNDKRREGERRVRIII